MKELGGNGCVAFESSCSATWLIEAKLFIVDLFNFRHSASCQKGLGRIIFIDSRELKAYFSLRHGPSREEVFINNNNELKKIC